MAKTYDRIDERLQGWIAALAAYRAQRNHRSLDGLPALPMAAGDRQADPGREREEPSMNADASGQRPASPCSEPPGAGR